MIDFVGTGLRLSPLDLRCVASLLGIDVPTVRAVLSVESQGVGFGPDRRPLINFEPHVFYQQLGPSPQRAYAVQQGVAYEKARTRPYPPDQATRYQQLAMACQIDTEAALYSTSWGIAQLMGFNYHGAGYRDVYQLVDGMKAGEAEQVFAMARFILHQRLHLALQRHDWASFAAGYNGRGYKAQRYDEKLAKAFSKHREEQA